MTAHDHHEASPLLAGALIAVAALPVLVLGLKAPLWLAVLAAAGVMAVAFLMHRRRHGAFPAQRALGSSIDEGLRAITRLERLTESVRAPAVRKTLHAIVASARAIAAELRTRPTALGDVHRVFTYYLPRAAGMADAYALLETRRDGDRARAEAIERLLARIDSALAAVARRLANDALAPLDVEMRLMDAALKEEMEP